MPLKETLSELLDIRKAKFPEPVDFDDNVMRKPHEHYKDNAAFAVFLYKKFCDICKSAENFKDKFDSVGSDADRTIVLLSDRSARPALEHLADLLLASDNGQEDTSNKKDDKAADEARKSGNKHFNRKEYDDALACYSQAIKLCSNGADLPLVVANRSAVLFHLKRFEDTLADIDDALELGYVLTHPNLLTRKITSLKLLGREDEARTTFDHGLKLSESQVTERSRSEWRSKLELAFVQQVSVKGDIRMTYHDTKTVHGTNATLESASSFVEMSYDEIKGRGLRVTRDVSKGEFLVVCKPFAAVLANSYASDFCDHCMRSLGGRCLYCANCTNVKYCSASCRAEASKLYHSIECPWLPTLRLYPNGLHALRALLTRGFDQSVSYSLNARKPSTSEWPQLGFGSRFECFYSLFKKQMDSLEFTYSYPMAASLYGLLCVRMGLVDPSDLMAFAATTIMDCLLIISRNADTVFTSDWSKIIGSAVHCTSALFNHSCQPNVDTYYVGSRVVHSAKRPLAKGDEIFVSYGVNFASDPIDERREFLRNSYKFDCFCERCLFELKGLSKCPSCGSNFERTVFNTLACRLCDVDEDGEFLSDDCFNGTSHDSYCSIV